MYLKLAQEHSDSPGVRGPEWLQDQSGRAILVLAPLQDQSG